MGSLKLAAFAAAIIAVVVVGSGGGIGFAEEGHTLTVTSTGCPAVDISGGKPGTTPYTAACADAASLLLSAPPAIKYRNGTSPAYIYFEFVRWIIDGEGQPVEQADVTITMGGDHAALAVYELPTLTVKSVPITDVPIGFIVSEITDGITDYSRKCSGDVRLQAPSSVTRGDVIHDLAGWEIDGKAPSCSPTFSPRVVMDRDHVAVAVYREREPVLRVVSKSVSRVSITGDLPGTTSYSAACQRGQTISLTAPPSITTGGIEVPFIQWMVNGVRQPEGETTLQFVMKGYDGEATAIYENPHPVLTVTSSLSAIQIDGDKPGTTSYSFTWDAGTALTLHAPEKVAANGNTYIFSSWMIGNDVAATSSELSFAPRVSLSVKATYVFRQFTLTVRSEPFPGVAIGSSAAKGTTDYTVTLKESTWVSVYAPLSVEHDNVQYSFARWVVDGVNKPGTTGSLSVTMSSDRTCLAVYCTAFVNVSSSPSGIHIAGDEPGITPYVQPCNPGDQVTLEAPRGVTLDSAAYDFVRWNIDGVDQPYGENAITVKVMSKTSVMATYEKNREVRVSSRPVSGVPISGNKPGTTDYSFLCGPSEIVSLEAPESISLSGSECYFAQWMLNGRGQPFGQRAVQFTRLESQEAVAVYAAARLRIQGPADRGEPPLPPGGGTFTVDIFLSNVGTFAGFETIALQFIDASGNDAGFLIGQGSGGNPAFDNLEIGFNDARWPSIFPIFAGDSTGLEWHRRLFGFLSMDQDTVVDEAWLCTLTYEYGPSAEGTYSITGHGDGTMAVNYDGEVYHYELPGTVVIGPASGLAAISPLAADLNDDCQVNESDLIAMRCMLGQRGSPGMRGDLNGDGVVNILDLIVLRSRMGKMCAGK